MPGFPGAGGGGGGGGGAASAAAAELEGQWFWVPHPEHGFEMAKLTHWRTRSGWRPKAGPGILGTQGDVPGSCREEGGKPSG